MEPCWEVIRVMARFGTGARRTARACLAEAGTRGCYVSVGWRVLVLSPNMRSVPNERNHVPETSTPDTSSALEHLLPAACFECAHSWCICTHAKAPRTPITPLIKLKSAAGPARTSAPPHNTHDRTEHPKERKEQNPAHPAKSGRSGTKKAIRHKKGRHEQIERK